MPLEANIQRSVINYAKSRGLLCKKLSVQGPMGNTGWPDYLLLGLDRPLDGSPSEPVVFFMEFKRPGGVLTPLQEETRKTIEERKFHYYVVDDAQEGKKLVDKELGL